MSRKNNNIAWWNFGSPRPYFRSLITCKSMLSRTFLSRISTYCNHQLENHPSKIFVVFFPSLICFCVPFQSVNVTNHTKGKVTVTWVGSTEHVFSISPASLDIPPLKTCSFRITFKPVSTTPSFPLLTMGVTVPCFYNQTCGRNGDHIYKQSNTQVSHVVIVCGS